VSAIQSFRSFAGEFSGLFSSPRYLVAILFAVFLLGSAQAQSTIFSASTVPSRVDSNDGKAIEAGVKFKSDSAGYITGIRFYKASANTGTHVANLWSSTGTLLATATYTAETSSGWQQANFASPVAIKANTIYVASYFAPNGHYSADTNYFQRQGVDNAPLHALSNKSSQNGVYRYSSSGGFPSNSKQSTNYWVDVTFQTSVGSTGTPQLSASAGSLSFGNVSVNTTSSLSLSLSSSGTAAVTINSAAISGTGFSLVAGTLPATLSPGQSLTLQVSFTPTSAKSFSGTVTVSSNSASGSTITVALSGTGVSNSPQLSLSSSSLAFGSIAMNSSTTQSLTLSSSGTSALTVSSASVSGAGFSLVGGSFPITLNVGQSAALQVQFRPSAAGAATGALSIASNSASGSPATVALSGTGTAIAHSVDLSWQAPTSSPTVVAGYNVYRMVSGGSAYTLLNSSSIAATAYTDSGVTSGTTYFYEVTSVDQNKVESSPTSSVSVTIP
jgi:hypothetical protein